MYEKYKSEPKDAGRKSLYQQFADRLDYLESNLASSINYLRDYQDENYKYNRLRTKLIKRGII